MRRVPRDGERGFVAWRDTGAAVMNQGGMVGLFLLGAIVTTAFARGDLIRLADERIALGFDPGRAYALREVRAPAQQADFLLADSALEPRDQGLWRLALRNASGDTEFLYPMDAASSAGTLTNGTLRLVWKGLSGKRIRADLVVTATVRLVPNRGRTEWNLAVTGRASGVLWEVDFPRFTGLGGLKAEQACVPWYLGRMVRAPRRRPLSYDLIYPQPASMQFLAYWGTPDARAPARPAMPGPEVETGWDPDRSAAAGLYWAAEDGAGYFKQFHLDTRSRPGELQWSITHYPGLTAWPPPARELAIAIDYRVPYPVVVVAFRGDYHEAAALYRRWAARQIWCRRGPVKELSEHAPAPGSEALALWTPPWFRNIGCWLKFYHEPAKVLPEWSAYRHWLRVPLASHYYRYTIARFDDNYPEFLPADPYLLEGVRAARELGVRPLPYTNGVIWDMDTQSWIRENGEEAAIKKEDGTCKIWDIRGERFAYMCPAAEPWRAKMREVCRKLVWEQGMNGVYFDCLAATRAIPCFDPAHGHSLRGGNYRAAGNRKLLEEVRRDSRRLDPRASFFTEEIGEQYLDLMDGFLTLDFTRSRSVPGERVFPLFSVVYHPWTLNFGSDLSLELKPDYFALQLGLLFLWGSTPMVSAITASPPRAGDANALFLREVVQAYYLVGKPFLQDGSWERIAVVPVDARSSSCGLELRSEVHRVDYQKRKHDRTWIGPAVAATAWRNGADLGVVMVNLTDRKRDVILTLDAGKLFGKKAAVLRGLCLWPRQEPFAVQAVRRFALPPRSVRIEAYTPKPERLARQRRRLETIDTELLVARKNEPFPPLPCPAGEVWACDDSPLRLHRLPTKPGTTLVEAVVVRPGAPVVVRRGRQAAQVAARAEGHGLPRAAAEQPFLLLRKLPHRLGPLPDNGAVTVFAGDRDFLDARLEAGGNIAFARPGIVLVRDLRAGRLPRDFGAGAATAISGLQSGPCRLVYVDPAGLTRRSAAVLREARGVSCAVREAGDLDHAVRAFTAKPTPETLARAVRRAADFALACDGCPALLGPVRPFYALSQRLTALAAIWSGWSGRIRLADDWLAPGIAKRLRVEIESMGPDGFSGAPGPVVLRPVADLPAGAFVVTRGPRVERPAGVDTAWSLTLRRGTYIERLVPLLAVVPAVGNDGRAYRLLLLSWLEANRPFELRIQSEPVTAVAGLGGVGRVVARNWSPCPVRVSFRAVGPAGWQPSCVPAAIEVPPLSDKAVAVRIGAPATARAGSCRMRIEADYSPLPDTGSTGFLTVSLLEALAPLDPAAYAALAPAPPEPPRLRQVNRLAFYAARGADLALTLENVRVTRYVDSLRFRLLDPALKPLESGKIPVDGKKTLKLTAARSGVYYLEVACGPGSTRVTATGTRVVETATRLSPLHLFCSPVTRYFYVPSGARSFVLGVRDGGADETARLVLRSPTGRVALDRDGNWDGGETEIPVGTGEAGGVWTFECRPRQDVLFWLGGEVTPCLAPTRAGVLKGMR